MQSTIYFYDSLLSFIVGTQDVVSVYADFKSPQNYQLSEVVGEQVFSEQYSFDLKLGRHFQIYKLISLIY